ncbi:MAG: four helix bundle protein [Candidatus Jorgensenbacteria bacterium]|nr:four helix bundle protein [Candidatus Jorgensenbacteria bacterium]
MEQQNSTDKISSYKDLIVWNKSMELVKSIYKLVNQFPQTETYALGIQMKRAVVSIPSNIAEGSRRSSRKDFRHFLLNAYGSGAELETQIEIARQLNFCNNTEFCGESQKLLSEVMKMLNKLVNSL